MILGKYRWFSAATAALALGLGAGGCTGGQYSLGIECTTSGTDRELQAAVDAQPRVSLCPGATFTLATTLILRRTGQILETLNRPTQPSEMATIILGPEFRSTHEFALAAPISGVQIASVRFDGNRRMLGTIDIFQLLGIGPGKQHQIIGNVFTDTPGWTHLHVVEPCDGSMIVGNTVETGTQSHEAIGGHNADGLSISCAHSTIADNVINDISGAGIVYYGGPGTVIRNNTITAKTTSASSGINVGDAVTLDHTGVVITGNNIKSVPPRYFHIGIAAGLRVWPPRGTPPAFFRDIMGVTVSNNVISGMIRYGLAVDGCLSCLIENNQILDWQPVPVTGTCPPSTQYIANVSGGRADGNLQAGYVDANIDDCVGAPLPP
ncbi:MAG TPA: right-handed parallel beta-helix repeat-containing protein [Polyangia bacterium]|nr:right-handed parallel beta-helix repeat-containing protein [Polyangia bacterium]